MEGYCERIGLIIEGFLVAFLSRLSSFMGFLIMLSLQTSLLTHHHCRCHEWANRPRDGFVYQTCNDKGWECFEGKMVINLIFFFH